MKKLFKLLLALFILLIPALAFNTVRFKSRQSHTKPVEPIPIDEAQNAKLLAGALRLATVSFENSNDWKSEPFTALQKPLVKAGMLMEPDSAAMVRTTTAVTVVRGGIKANVLPGDATAVVNFRILPGDSGQSVIDHVRSVIANPAVKVEPVGLFTEPSFESNTDGPAFSTIRDTISQLFPEAVVSPYLVVGATDSRYYARLTRNIFRFLPMIARKGDLGRVHGIDERISVKDFASCVRFYRQLILNSASTSPLAKAQ